MVHVWLGSTRISKRELAAKLIWLTSIGMVWLVGPVKEDTVRSIMAYYFKQKGIEAIPQKGPGPDFLHAGSAIEIKGSDSGFDRAIRQFIEYSFTGKYKGLSVAFPHDFLDGNRLIAFHAFCTAVYEIRRPDDVTTYVVGDDKDSYYVKRFAGLLFAKEVLDWIPIRYANLSRQEKGLTKSTQIVRQEVRDVTSLISEVTNWMLQYKPDAILPKTAINHTTSQTQPTAKSPP